MKKNCAGMKRYWAGGALPYETGSGETETEGTLGDLTAILGQSQAPAAAKQKKPIDWRSILSAGAMGAAMGGVGGNAGMIAAPLTMLLQQLIGKKFGQATSGKTPKFTGSSDPYGSGE